MPVKKKSEMEQTANCGLVMPISDLDGCTSDHWLEVRQIITEAIGSIDMPKFTIKVVSDADDVGVIQKRIVQNVYSSDVVICDVSGKNPNVMFELGLRLAFDKATVIVKDDKTDYSFDTAVIEHLIYPRDLRFARIVEFKTNLVTKVLGTYKAVKEDPQHSPFLKNFGKFQVANLTQTEVSPDKMVLEMLSEMQVDIASLKRATGRSIERIRGENYVEGLNRIALCIAEYQKQRAADDNGPLQMSEELARWMLNQFDAPKYFDSRKEFERALEIILKANPK